ncbi:CAP domain-containing protein [Paraburkholderia sp. J94]|uniref:CAP domain-containing protein n=1 Tax=Paraburkholderia sp. J94 TaxID=2805441 RepID=UPI002AB051A5|nr:CAP domain-containing protein [Paraburkholderia sp. J94]
MRFSRFKLEAAVVLAAALLAACGGGGGGDSSGSSGSASSNSSGSSSTRSSSTSVPSTNGSGSTSGVALLAPAATSTSLPSASGNATTDGIAWLNAVRQNVGLATLTNSAGLATASLDHATYLVDNQTYGHSEVAGHTGYTGATPYDRIAAEGSYSMMGEVVVAGQPAAFNDSLSPVETLFDAPFHRIVMLDDFTQMGVGSMTNANWEAFNIDFGSTGADTMSATTLVAYPYSGQQGVPASWFANEDPNPFASQPSYEMTTVGYPVTVQSAFGTTLSSLNFTITSASGANVSCLAQTPQTTPAELSNAAMCVPYSALASGTTYTVQVTGVLTDSSNQTYSINVAWTFTTAASGVAHSAVQSTQSRPLPKF